METEAQFKFNTKNKIETLLLKSNRYKTVIKFE